MNWLETWEIALKEARRDGKPGEVWKFDRASASFRLVAKTRHPAFMGLPPKKHDPERDRG